MTRTMDQSWLLGRRPPYWQKKTPPQGPEALWWGVIRQAAHDLRFSHRSCALDALEFLTTSGLWLTSRLYRVPRREYQEEVTALLVRRNRFVGDHLESTTTNSPASR